MRKLFMTVLAIVLLSGYTLKTDVVTETIPSETAAAESIKKATTTSEVTTTTEVTENIPMSTGNTKNVYIKYHD